MHSFRVPDKEWSKWQAVASEADKSLSSWLRELANNASRAG